MRRDWARTARPLGRPLAGSCVCLAMRISQVYRALHLCPPA
jgi:hypothetical protein